MARTRSLAVPPFTAHTTRSCSLPAGMAFSETRPPGTHACPLASRHAARPPRHAPRSRHCHIPLPFAPRAGAFPLPAIAQTVQLRLHGHLQRLRLPSVSVSCGDLAYDGHAARRASGGWILQGPSLSGWGTGSREGLWWLASTSDKVGAGVQTSFGTGRHPFAFFL